MITADPTMTHLFQQLGLEETPEAIAAFIQDHQLASEVTMGEAPFWSDAQRQFLVEQLKADAPWALVVDQLNEALHASAVQRSTGL